jgi:hypothetical protein
MYAIAQVSALFITATQASLTLSAPLPVTATDLGFPDSNILPRDLCSTWDLARLSNFKKRVEEAGWTPSSYPQFWDLAYLVTTEENNIVGAYVARANISEKEDLVAHVANEKRIDPVDDAHFKTFIARELHATGYDRKSRIDGVSNFGAAWATNQSKLPSHSATSSEAHSMYWLTESEWEFVKSKGGHLGEHLLGFRKFEVGPANPPQIPPPRKASNR